MMLRHDIKLIKSICTKLIDPFSEAELKQLGNPIDINNCSSANSTPINNKSIQSSAQNSSLKKRAYQDYHDIIEKEKLTNKEATSSEDEEDSLKYEEAVEPKRLKIEEEKSEDTSEEESRSDA